MNEKPKRHHRFWTHLELEMLAELVQEPISVDEIAQRLGRSRSAVYYMIHKQGLKKTAYVPPHIREKWDEMRKNPYSRGIEKYNVPEDLIPAYRHLRSKRVNARDAARRLGLVRGTDR